MWLVLIESSFQGLSGAIKTVEIVKELVKIGLNKVYNNIILFSLLFSNQITWFILELGAKSSNLIT